MLNPFSQHSFSDCIDRALLFSWTCQRQLHLVIMLGRNLRSSSESHFCWGTRELKLRRYIRWMSLLDYRTSRLTKLVVTKKRAGTSSGSELCDMDYTVIETKRQVSDAGNPLQFILQHPSSGLWESSDILHLAIPVWERGQLPDRPAPEPERCRCCSGLRMGSTLPKMWLIVSRDEMKMKFLLVTLGNSRDE